MQMSLVWIFIKSQKVQNAIDTLPLELNLVSWLDTFKVVQPTKAIVYGET